MKPRTTLLAVAVTVAAAVVALAALAGGDTDDVAAGDTLPAAMTDAPSTTDGAASPPATSPPATTGPSQTDPPVTVLPSPADLPDDLALVTSRWPTDWTKRTIDLNELRVGILAPDPRDAIRPLDSPSYETVEAARDVARRSGVGHPVRA